MNTNTVCIFPDTMPGTEILFPLVQVFEPVVYLRALENDAPDTAELSPLSRQMIDQGMLLFDCPAPLAENRERFLQLVNDLQHRPDDYAGQLSHLSLAGLSRSKTDESKTSIINTLLKQTGIDDEQQEQRTMLLWQARLVLKLGEILDRDQKELQKNLGRIATRESGLIEELREESEQPFSLPGSTVAVGSRTDSQQRLRLKAWSRLFALGAKRPAASTFVTTSRDAYDLLIEYYELEQKNAPQPILNLLLPGTSPNDNLAKQLKVFRDEASGLIDSCRKILENPTSVTEQERKDLDGDNSAWARLLEKHYPAAEHSRCSLTLCRLPGIDKGNLFLETFGRDEDGMLEETEEQGTGIVLGVLEGQAVS